MSFCNVTRATFAARAQGFGIPVQYRGSANNPSMNAHRANLSAPINSLGSEIAADELNHVIFLRTALGAAAPDKPAVWLLDLHDHVGILAPCF